MVLLVLNTSESVEQHEDDAEGKQVAKDCGDAQSCVCSEPG